MPGPFPEHNQCVASGYIPVNGEGSWAAEIVVAENHASKGVFTSRLLYIAYKPLFYCGHVYFAVYSAHVRRYRLNDVGETFAETYGISVPGDKLVTYDVLKWLSNRAHSDMHMSESSKLFMKLASERMWVDGR